MQLHHIEKMRQAVFFGLFLLVLSSFAHAAAKAVARWKFQRQHACRKPNAASSGLFYVGRTVQLLKAMKDCTSLDLVLTWHKQHGKTFTTIVGSPRVMTIEPKNVQAILALKFKDFELGRRNKALAPLLGQGIFASDGSVWEHSRALVRPNFVRNQISDMDVYEKHVANLLRSIPADCSTVDLQTLFFRMTIDSATEFLFGESIGALSAGDDQPSFAQDFNKSQDGLAVRTRLGAFMFIYQDWNFSKATVDARVYVDQFVQRAIDYRTANDQNGAPKESESDKRYVFLHELSKQTTDKKVLTDQLLNILLAGRDTTASLLSITCWVLARRPDIWNKLREEVLKLDNQIPSFEDIKSLTYLNWILNETLRLYPVVPMNIRQANKDTFLPVGGGPDGKDTIFIPKGKEVMYSVYSMHRLPEVYGSDAEEYRPERWASLKPGWAYIPFNGGPRICPGQQFALIEAGYTLARLARHFQSIEARDDRPFREGLTLTLASENGTIVSLTRAKTEVQEATMASEPEPVFT